MGKSLLVIDTPETCGDCPCCIYTAEEKYYIGYYHTSNDDYYCKVLDRFMKYDEVDGGVDILGKPVDCPLQEESDEKIKEALEKIERGLQSCFNTVHCESNHDLLEGQERAFEYCIKTLKEVLDECKTES